MQSMVNPSNGESPTFANYLGFPHAHAHARPQHKRKPMPKPHTFPDLFEQAHTVSTSRLREWGYLRAGRLVSLTVTWSHAGEVTGSVGVRIDTTTDCPFLEFSYRFGGEPVQYRVHLDAVPSNLGKGSVWYFICPRTMKRCRVLYQCGGRFVHRDECKGMMYLKQTYSHDTRAMIGLLDAHMDADKARAEMYGRHFRTHYKGRPTKRYTRLLERLRGAFTDPDQLSRMLMM